MMFRGEEVEGCAETLDLARKESRLGPADAVRSEGRANRTIICRSPPLHRATAGYLIDTRPRRIGLGQIRGQLSPG